VLNLAYGSFVFKFIATKSKNRHLYWITLGVNHQSVLLVTAHLGPASFRVQHIPTWRHQHEISQTFFLALCAFSGDSTNNWLDDFGYRPSPNPGTARLPTACCQQQWTTDADTSTRMAVWLCCEKSGVATPTGDSCLLDKPLGRREQ